MRRLLAVLLALLIAAPVSAQVITTGAPTAGSGGGSGNVTGTFTTGVVPMGTAAHTLADSLNAVVIGTNGSIGFNTGNRVEVVSNGATLTSASTASLTIHDSAGNGFPNIYWYDDGDGFANGVSVGYFGTFPNNGLEFDFGNGAGGSASPSTAFFSPANISFALDDGAGHTGAVSFTPAVVEFNAGNLVFGHSGTGFADSSTNSVFINLKNAAVSLSGFNNSFIVTQGSQSQDLAIAVTPNAIAQIQQTNTTHTALLTVSTVLTNTSGVATANGAQGVAALDAGDATGNVFLHVQSPQIGSAARGGVVIDNTLSAGSKPFLVFQVDATHSVAFGAPSTSSPAFEVFTLPPAYPAANGQPLVSTTAGVMSFAAGKTQAYVLCTGAACATSCTLTFTGGILTANSGTCP